ncbi:protein of unknown function [Singulisphaera sp. GP187]|uniref:DUF4129 domain-containing protein n=1 Tax=Singulisphaera sp. GP187 TaxID=1882752 RepID=UPI00092A6648|nr:DUF4129 domain-containing protein [Singulisphaera sp. GP187]SIO08988.1 protein of unknown function [Singulisphaera sp. GP187]
MVSLTLWLILGVAGAVGPDSQPDSEADLAVRAALGRGGYPWYNAKTDSVIPLWPPQPRSFRGFDRWFGWLGRLRLGRLHLGELLIIGMVILALSVLLVVLVELWRRYRPISSDSEPGVTSIARANRIEGLPAGVRPETDDPWAEAVRWRASGDYANAIVCLFAHQLLTLHRLRILRLKPGRTGRQLVRAIDDPRYRTPVDATLGLFESVYYGHLTPSPEAFDGVWTQAEDFERLVAAGPVS